MTELHSLGHETLLEKVKELGVDAEIDGLPLALYADGLPTLKLLQSAGVDIIPKRGRRAGHPSILEWAIRKDDAITVVYYIDRLIDSFEPEDYFEAVKAAIETCAEKKIPPILDLGDIDFIRRACHEAWSLTSLVNFHIKSTMQLFDSWPRSETGKLICVIKGLLAIRAFLQEKATPEPASLNEYALRGFIKSVDLLLDSASKEERIQVLFSGAIHGDAWIMKSALESAAKKGEDFLLSEDQITNLADAISRSPVDACLVATKSSYALGKNIDFLWHLLLHIIKRDRVDCLEEIISSGCVSANASIFGAPLLVVAVHSMARECFIHLLSKGAIPFYRYPSQFCQRVGFAYTNITYGPSHPLSKVSAEQKDIHFFAGCDEGSAIDLNNKASRMFLWKE